MLTHKQTIGAIVIALALYALTSLLTVSDAEAIRIERMRQSKQNMDMLSGQIRTLTEDYRHAESCYKANSNTGTLVDCSRATTRHIPTVTQAHAEAAKSEAQEYDPVVNEQVSEISKPKTPTIAIYRPNGDDPDNCADFKIHKVKKVELHYTATPYDTTLEALYNGHKKRFGIEYYIGYHYVIKPDGSITNTRPETCGAVADKAHNNNTENIHIAFIGDDKPTEAQTRSLVWLVRKIQNYHWLDVTAVTSHAHEDAKSPKENTKYWYGSHENFLELLRASDRKILFRGNENRLVQFAYNISGGDMDFLATVAQESAWDIHAVGDKGVSIGLCQYHGGYNPGLHAEYKTYEDPLDKVRHCLGYYREKSLDARGVGNYLKGYNNRQKRMKEFTFLN